MAQINNELFQENSTRTQNEQVLFLAWKASQQEKNSLNDKVSQLQEQLVTLQNKYIELEKQLMQKMQITEPEEVQYYTDEEELARETEWIRVKTKNNKQTKNNKKRKMDSSLSPIQNVTIEKKPEVKKVKMPPPILVDGIKDFSKLHDELTNITKDLHIKLINDENIKINVKYSDSYKAIADLVNGKDYSWHSYENKQNRPIKVMAKKLHYSCAKEKIEQDLKKRGYKILEVTPKLKYKTKQALNMFMLSFSQDEDINKIYGITDIMGMRVEIVPLKKNNLIPQCKNCQGYGHTQNYCARRPRCVRCTGNHSTSQCDKPKSACPKCIHCGGEHPANYRGCRVVKELQRIKNKQATELIRSKQPQSDSQRLLNLKQQTQNNVSGPRNYSSVVKAGPTNAVDSNSYNDNKRKQSTTEDTLVRILHKLDQLDGRINLEKRYRDAALKNRNG